MGGGERSLCPPLAAPMFSSPQSFIERLFNLSVSSNGTSEWTRTCLFAARLNFWAKELEYPTMSLECGQSLKLGMPEAYKLHWVPDFYFGQPGDVHLIDCKWSFYDSSQSEYRPIDAFGNEYVDPALS